jgi:hypothetical protein
MNQAPKWFEKELSIIDPTYYVWQNPFYRYYEIKKKIEVDNKIKMNGERYARLRLNNPTVAVFEHLNDNALNRLRKRKLEGIRLRQNSLAYIQEIERQNKEAQEKKIQLGKEMVAKGLMKIFNWGKSKTYDMKTSASPTEGTNDGDGT